jgi:ornithine--oxo-acid transaminase
MVAMLRTIGYDVQYVRAEGPYLFDGEGRRYLDMLSGFGVYALGRNHPGVRRALRDVLDAELPNLVQFDASVLAGLLGEKIMAVTPPGLERVFFANSGVESVEAAIKFSRCATGRARVVSCHNGYHGLTMGSLSAIGESHWREGFGPFLPGFEQIPFGDVDALARALANGVFMPPDDYLPGAAELCRRHGTLLVADEAQTGLGRTGKMWAVEHWDVEPDLLCMAKALSGGHVPIGAVACRKDVFEKVFNRMDRVMVHGSTFAKNNLAMAAGLATLEALETEGIIQNAARVGANLLADLQALVPRFELLKEVRGKGLLIGLEFAEPRSFKLRASWKLVEAANKGLFAQLITVPLFTRHRILSQVAGHEMHIVKFLPSLTIGDDDVRWVTEAVEDVVADAHRVPGAVWSFGKTLARQALKVRAGAR